MCAAEQEAISGRGFHQLFPFLPKFSGFHETEDGNLIGTCNICGNPMTFVEFRPQLERESGFCTICGSFSRQRQIVAVLRKMLGQEPTAPIQLPEGFTIYNTESTRAVHNLLSNFPGYVCSEYFGSALQSGPHVGKVHHQDLQRLSFPSKSMDIVLSSDVFEHIPHPYEAHREVFRVLKPGGHHIFTVPFLTDAVRDDIRATEAHGYVTYLKEKIFHGDPVKPNDGVLVWTLPGLEMLVELAKIGFEPRIFQLCLPEYGIIGPWSLVFVATRPLG